MVKVFSGNQPCSAPSPLARYVYDTEGRRVERVTAQGTWDFAYDLAGRAVSEYDAADTWSRGEVWAGGRHLATYHDYNWPDAALYFSAPDGLGSERLRTRTDGSLAETCTALPFGDGLNCSFPNGAATDSPLHFTGQPRDAETGLDDFGARLYSSRLGRWMSPDPLPWLSWQHGNEDQRRQFVAYLENPQHLDEYAYALNNPVTLTDPTGMNACGGSNDATCHVTVTIQDRSRNAKGNYNDQFTKVQGQKGYNATATVTVNGKAVGMFLVKTPPSSGKYATIANGTYKGTFEIHDGRPSIRLGTVPTVGPNPTRRDGRSIATGILVHAAGGGNFVGIGRNGLPVSAGCQVVCTSQYGGFERATGLDPTAGPPQQHFTVQLDSAENSQ